MKQNKSKGLRKMLLMAVATALVIAISVSATLAFLTDSTKERDNVFQGKTSNVQGQIIEPHFSSSSTYFYSPGTETQKDPMVQNDSSEDPIFTAIKLTFWIRVDSTDTSSGTDGFIQVPYSVFDDYVTVTYGGSKTAGFNADAYLTGANSTHPWYETTGSDSSAKYFAYKTAIDKSDETDNAGNDTTAAIFDYVTMSQYINIPETLAGDKTVQNTSDGISDAAALLNATVADGQTVQNQYRQEFESCDIKIKIEGYGIAATTAGEAITDSMVSELTTALG